MNKHIGIIRKSFIFAVVVSFVALAVSVGAQDKPARTYYESLNLATPEDAVTTFTDAFEREDYLTVFMVLSPNSQRQWLTAANLFKFGVLFNADYEKQAIENIPKYVDLESMDSSALFDAMMYKAAQDDALLIDLRGETTIIGSSETITEDDVPAVDVTAIVDGIEGDVIFRTVQSPSKRWRVLQVIVMGGDVEMLPWSVPSTTD